MRLLIVDDHPAIAAGLAALFARSTTISVVGVVCDERAADAILAAGGADVVLCDVMLGGRDAGFDLLARHGGRARFVLYSAYDYQSHHVRAVRDGAAGYLPKIVDVETLISAVTRAATGAAVFTPEVLASVRTAPRPPTARERELLGLLASGATNDELAYRMQLRVKSVEGMLRRLFDRYGVENRTQLARFAERQGWLTGAGSEHAAGRTRNRASAEGGPVRR